MNKLDEIDKEAGDCQDNGDAELWMKDYAALLIRSVRQLGAVAGAVLESKTDDDGYVFPALGEPLIDSAYDALDPDVLELIESPIRVVANDGPENKDR